MARMKSLTGSDLPCYRIVKVNKILVSQPKPASDKSPYYDIARKYGVEVVFRPFIKVEGLSAREFRQQKININDFTAVIFTAPPRQSPSICRNTSFTASARFSMARPASSTT